MGSTTAIMLSPIAPIDCATRPLRHLWRRLRQAIDGLGMLQAALPDEEGRVQHVRLFTTTVAHMFSANHRSVRRTSDGIRAQRRA